MADDLRARIDAAIRPNMLVGLQDAELDGAGGRKRINEWADWISRQVADLVQPEVDGLGAQLAEVTDVRDALRRRLEEAGTEIRRLTALLRDHDECAVCGHERRQHRREPVLRRDWCSGCTTADDLHEFKEPTGA